MQRPLLLLALAAVAVLGIAGLLAAPGGENPSAGDGTTAPATEATTITLGRVAGSSAQVAVLGGVLRASDGRPVANRPVELDWRDGAGTADGPAWRAWYANPMARTLADGSFSMRVRARDPDGTTSVYRVRFPGDPWFAPSASEGVTVVSPAR